jgi:hypothetical protein
VSRSCRAPRVQPAMPPASIAVPAPAPGGQYRGARARRAAARRARRILLPTGEAQLENSRFVLHEQHLRGSAALLSRDADELIRIEDGAMTFCAPGNNDWLLQTRELELDGPRHRRRPRGHAAGRGAIRCFYLPWMSFPLDDAAPLGPAVPDLRHGQPRRRGHRHADLPEPGAELRPAYTPRYISQRGLNHEVHRALSRPLERRLAGRRQLHRDDKQYAEDFPNEKDADRWLARCAQRRLRGTLALPDQLHPGVGRGPDPRPRDLAPGQRGATSTCCSWVRSTTSATTG